MKPSVLSKRLTVITRLDQSQVAAVLGALKDVASLALKEDGFFNLPGVGKLVLQSPVPVSPELARTSGPVTVESTFQKIVFPAETSDHSVPFKSTGYGGGMALTASDQPTKSNKKPKTNRPSGYGGGMAR